MASPSQITSAEAVTQPSSAPDPHVDITAERDNLEEEIDPNAVGGRVSDLASGYYLTPSFLATFIATCLGISCFKLGYVLPVNTLGIINADLGPDPSNVWVATGWNLCAALGYTLVGRLSDVFGRRWFFIGGNVLGLVSSIMGATAKNITTLIGSSCLAGLAASVQLSFPIIIGELIPNKHRAVANGVILVTAVPFSVFGPVIARSFVLNTAQGWRWSYYLNTIFSGIVVILYFFFYHPPTYKMLHARRTTKLRLRKSVDVGGAVLFSLGLALFLLGMSWGGQQYPWKSSLVIGTLVGGVATLVVFVFYEIYVPLDYPFIPMRVFKNFSFVTTVIAGMVGSIIYYSMNVLWPRQVSQLYDTDLMKAGWTSMTIGGGTLLGQVTGAMLCQPLGKHKWQLIVGCASMTAFIGALAACDETTRTLGVVFTLLGSFCVGYVELVVLTTAPLCLGPADIGLANGVGGAVRAGAGAVATAIYVTILNNKLSANVPKYVTPAAVDAGLPESSIPSLIAGLGSGNITGVPGINPVIQTAAQAAYKAAYSQSFKIVYLASIAFGLLALGASVLTPNLESRFNDEVARKLHGKDVDVVEEKQIRGIEDLKDVEGGTAQEVERS